MKNISTTFTKTITQQKFIIVKPYIKKNGVKVKCHYRLIKTKKLIIGHINIAFV